MPAPDRAKPRMSVAAEGTRHPLDPSIQTHTVRFTGSGREYFRIWLVNLLLKIVTLGFYTPLARRRTAQYFFGHTVVADSPLEFVVPPGRMMVGFVLLVLLMVAFQVAQNSGQDLAVALFTLGGAALAPWFWGSAVRFRLNATRWRGVRMQFGASWREIYRASWPVFVIALVWIAASLALAALTPQTLPGSRAAPATPNLSLVGMVLLAAVSLSLLAAVRLDYNYQGLAVSRSRLGDQPGRWKPLYRDFLRIWAGTLAVFVATVLVVGLVLAGLMLLFGLAVSANTWRYGLFVVILLGFVAALLALLLGTAPARAYREARMFRLFWSQIGISHLARARCRLPVGGYVALRIRNVLLTLLTLGFYRPFALVSEYRMRVESVRLYVKGGLDQLTGGPGRSEQGLGDAVAEAAGFDLIG